MRYCGFMLMILIRAMALPLCADEPQVYNDACVYAQQHAQNPSGWTVNNLKTITAPGDGNHWSTVTTPDGTSQQVLVRAFTNAQYYNRSTDPLIGKYQQQFNRNALWVSTGDELPDFLRDNKVKAADAALRTAQLLGLPTKSITADKYTSVVEMYVSPDKLWRPTKDADIRQQPTALPNGAFAARPDYIPEAVYTNYTKPAEVWPAVGGWYLTNVNDSYTPYQPPAYPWTQLGYTYDWGNGGTDMASIRGLSEFVVLGKVWSNAGFAAPWLTTSSVYTIQSYIYKTGGLGSGNFRVTDTCDTIWTGTMFQADGDTIEITPTGSVSGGEGILVSSPGYTITNAGVIHGPTTAKYLTVANTYFGPAGSSIYLVSGGNVNNAATGIMENDSIAIESAGGSTVINNLGGISALHTAIKSTVSGSTLTVDNHGHIEGGNHAVRAGDGNDSLTVHNGGTVRGSIDLGSSSAVNGDAVTFNSGSTFIAVVNPEAGSNSAIIAKNVDVRNATLRVETVAGQLPREGGIMRVVECDRLVGDKPFALVQSQYAMFDYLQIHPDNGAYVDIVTTHNSYAGVAGGVDDRLAGTGSALDRLAGSSSGDMNLILDNIDSRTTAGAVASAVRQLSPMVYTAMPHVTFETDRAFYDTVINRNRTMRDDIMDRSAKPLFCTAKSDAECSGMTPLSIDDIDSWNPYVDGFGTWGRQKSNDDVAGYRFDTWGGIAGMEKRFGGNLMVGAGVGGSRTRVDFKDDAGSDATINAVRPIVYSGLNLGNFSADLALGYGYNQYETNRRIQFGDINRTAESNYDGHEVSAMMNLGYKLYVTEKTVI